MKLDNFKSFLGISYGDTIDKAIEVFGNPNDEYRNEENHYCVYYYHFEKDDVLSISYNKENNLIESMFLGQRHTQSTLGWLRMKQIEDEKSSFLGLHIDEIIDVLGVPTEEEVNDFVYKGDKIEIDFNCPEENDFFCQRILLNWYF
ncbi:MAG: hypothetical protein C0592_06920 [Marinilabiliales bacterium]|mgnify:CR=1 FL=1|nr:MAG: hypothetical protein C0592_06920 [Marinilabiliales bacterium]